MTDAKELDQLLQQAISAIRSGRKREGMVALRELLQRNPKHEQGWLWLSGVEESDEAKRIALQKVLEINPNSALARKGLAMLEPAPKLDFAALSGGAAPPPARAAGMGPPPARASGLGSLPPMAQPSIPKEVPAFAPPMQPQAPFPPAPMASEAPASGDVGMDALQQLRPALDRAPKKRRILPRMSELVFLLFFVVVLLGAFLGFRSWLANNAVNANNQTAADRANQALPTATAIVDPQRNNPPPAPAAAPPQQPSSSGQVYNSRSYILDVSGSSVNEATGTLLVNVTVRNPLQAPVAMRLTDFAAVNGVGGALALDQGQSSLLAGGLEIAPGSGRGGIIAFRGDISRRPMSLVWRPFSGGVNIRIPLQ